VPDDAPADLTVEERQALGQLDEAGGVLSRWPVGRAVALPLQRRGYVMNFSDFVLLTDDGRAALRGEEGER
jgi:hypothetical protein